MANKQLVDFLTAENELDGKEPVYIAQNGKTRKTLLSKIKEFIIGTTSMGTEAADVTGAVAELKGKIDSNTTQLKDMANNFYSLNSAKTIEENTDLNNLGIIGNYVCTGSAVGKTLSNTPVQGGFMLHTERITGEATNYIKQTLSTIGTPPVIYVRTKNNGVWGEWFKQQFLQDSGWLDLPLNDGIAGSVTPRYRKYTNDLMLDGRVKGLNSTGGTIGTLPSGYRPNSSKLYLCGTDADDVVIRVIINSNGRISVPACAKLKENYTIYLDNIMIKCG